MLDPSPSEVLDGELCLLLSNELAVLLSILDKSLPPKFSPLIILA